MAMLFLIRHGEASASWAEADDPGLSPLGRTQAAAVAAEIAALCPDAGLPLVTSPLRRCRETAEPLAGLWAREPVVNDLVAEIPSPPADVGPRGPWLRGIMSGSWADADGWLLPWRDRIIENLRRITDDTVIFSHFVAINVIAGQALGDDRVVCFEPDNCSFTRIENRAGELRLVELGRERETKIN